jgi:hypothetical protein
MNTTSQMPKRGQSSRCPAFANLLPLLDSPGLDAQEDAAVRAHLDSCAACQAQRAAYHQMTLEARRTLSPAATTRRHQTEELLASILQETPAPEAGVSSPSRNPVRPRGPIRPRRLIAGLAPLAVVLAIVVVAATLFASHPHPGGSAGNNSPTKTSSTPKGFWSDLHAISMVSADEGWAAGNSGPCDRNPINDVTLLGHCQVTYSLLDPLLLHYQHGTWTPVHVTFKGALNTISMLSATDGWAGGNDLFVHYDGHTWKPMPNPNQVTFNRLQMLSDTDGWAVGSIGNTQAILHYDGQTWTAQPLPASIASLAQQRYSSFGSLAMISPTEGWVGATLASDTQNAGTSTPDLTAAILHYANGQWTLQSSTKGAYLASISMLSATDGWASGEAGTTAGSQHGFLLHYTQGKWTEVSPSSDTGDAGAISMVSANDGWAVSSIESDHNGPWISYLLHYNGQQWTLVPALAFQHQVVGIKDLHMLSATEGWGVGDLMTLSGQRNSKGEWLILSVAAVMVHYHNGTWSIVPTP